MGRRALRKIDPELDLSPYFREMEELPPAVDLLALFDQSRPLEVEVGSGKGLFMESATALHPDRCFLGIEIARKYARFAAARLAKHARNNGLMVRGDALAIFRQQIPAARLAAVHVYFPDPWWKKRHQKRRVMNEMFVRDIERTLIPGGYLHFWTDVLQYYQISLQTLAENTRLDGPHDVAEKLPQHDRDYQTHFERRMRLQGKPVYRAPFISR